jgi:hypothetical protein
MTLETQKPSANRPATTPYIEGIKSSKVLYGRVITAALSLATAALPEKVTRCVGYVLEAAGKRVFKSAEGLTDRLLAVVPRGRIGLAARVALGALGIALLRSSFKKAGSTGEQPQATSAAPGQAGATGEQPQATSVAPEQAGATGEQPQATSVAPGQVGATGEQPQHTYNFGENVKSVIEQFMNGALGKELEQFSLEADGIKYNFTLQSLFGKVENNPGEFLNGVVIIHQVVSISKDNPSSEGTVGAVDHLWVVSQDVLKAFEPLEGEALDYMQKMPDKVLEGYKAWIEDRISQLLADYYTAFKRDNAESTAS